MTTGLSETHEKVLNIRSLWDIRMSSSSSSEEPILISIWVWQCKHCGKVITSLSEAMCDSQITPHKKTHDQRVNSAPDVVSFQEGDSELENLVPEPTPVQQSSQQPSKPPRVQQPSSTVTSVPSSNDAPPQDALMCQMQGCNVAFIGPDKALQLMNHLRIQHGAII